MGGCGLTNPSFSRILNFFNLTRPLEGLMCVLNVIIKIRPLFVDVWVVLCHIYF